MPIQIIRYASKNLEPGEKILFQTRTHWITLAKPMILMMVAIAVFEWANRPDTPSIGVFLQDPVNLFLEHPFSIITPVAALMFLQGFATFGGRIIALISSELTVTTRRVIDKEGLIWRNANELDARKLEGSELVSQSWLGQLMDYGTVAINGIGGKEIRIGYACHPLEVRRQVSKLIAHYDKRQSPAKPPHSPADSPKKKS